MFDLPGILGTMTNLLVIIIGFGLIVFVHELGHFLAAKWAGIRVLAFSMGFGPVVCSYRKGIGFRRGSSEPEYLRSLGTQSDDGAAMSPTEYRWSALPLGGYVKMLGQEDLNPGAVSSSPDSYQNCPIPKRLVVISAGVVVNVITAAMLFIVVFMVGLENLPAQIGTMDDDSPARRASAIGDSGAADGLLRGDVITYINDSKIYGFRDLSSTIAMAPKSSPSTVIVQREGYDEPIIFELSPEKSAGSGLLDMGVYPMLSNTIIPEADPTQWARFMDLLGGVDLQPGDQLIRVAGQPVSNPYTLIDQAHNSEGHPFQIDVRRGANEHEITIQPIVQIQQTLVEIEGSPFPVEHILGLTGVLCVDPQSSEEQASQGLMPGDVFLRIGQTHYPSESAGISAVRALSGKTVDIEVLRDGQRLTLDVDVSRNGTIGFYPASTIDETNLLASPGFDPGVDLPASRVVTRPGSRLLAINEVQIPVLRDAIGVLIDQTNDAYGRGEESFVVRVQLELPLPTQPDGQPPIIEEEWTVSRAEIEEIRALGWTLQGDEGILTLFTPVIELDRSETPIGAIKRGLHESKRVMTTVYLTFVRLYQGSVQVRHLKGPVGIAHLGTQVADQGLMMVLFFMGMISINLAVINFLPLPIVDGGQFLMLIYEWVRGKPLPIAFQNVITMLGLLFIAVLFLYITFNDVLALFGA